MILGMESARYIDSEFRPSDGSGISGIISVTILSDV